MRSFHTNLYQCEVKYGVKMFKNVSRKPSVWAKMHVGLKERHLPAETVSSIGYKTLYLTRFLGNENTRCFKNIQEDAYLWKFSFLWNSPVTHVKARILKRSLKLLQNAQGQTHLGLNSEKWLNYLHDPLGGESKVFLIRHTHYTMPETESTE